MARKKSMLWEFLRTHIVLVPHWAMDYMKDFEGGSFAEKLDNLILRYEVGKDEK